VSLHRTWGFIGIGAGRLIAGAGPHFWAQLERKNDARKDLRCGEREQRQALPRLQHLGRRSQFSTNSKGHCDDFLASKQSAYDSGQGKDIIGFVGIGVGAAAIVTGVVVLLTAPAKTTTARSSPRITAFTLSRSRAVPATSAPRSPARSELGSRRDDHLIERPDLARTVARAVVHGARSSCASCAAPFGAARRQRDSRAAARVAPRGFTIAPRICGTCTA